MNYFLNELLEAGYSCRWQSYRLFWGRSQRHWAELLLRVFKQLVHFYYNQTQLTVKLYFGFPGGATDKDPACQCRRHKTWVRSLDWEDSLEEGMATHFSILAWRIPWTEEPAGLQSIGSQSRTWLEWLSMHTTFPAVISPFKSMLLPMILGSCAKHHSHFKLSLTPKEFSFTIMNFGQCSPHWLEAPSLLQVKSHSSFKAYLNVVCFMN